MILPLMLAGPLLRRSSSQEVWVCLVFSRELSPDFYLEMEVYERLPSDLELILSKTISTAIGRSVADTAETALHLPILERLHIYWIKALPVTGKPFPHRKFLYYEVFLVAKDGIRYGISEHQLTSKRSVWNPVITEPVFTLGYQANGMAASGGTNADGLLDFDRQWRKGPSIDIDRKGKVESLPHFVLGGTNNLTVWTGSCIKLHGEGEAASRLMFSRSSEDPGLLPKRCTQPDFWPNALSLIGDQIYADDVSFCMFEGIIDLARLLAPDHKDCIAGINFCIGCPSVNDRAKLTERGNSVTPFSVDKRVFNQLFSLPEFCAYYLMHLNAALWPDLEKAATRASPKLRIKSLGIPDSREHLRMEKSRLSKSRHSVRDFASVIANIPCYCLLDDHEITDDFLISGDFASQLGLGKLKDGHNVSKVGQYLVANGLLAYAAFQGIGNDPSSTFKIVEDVLLKNIPEKFKGLCEADWSFLTPTEPNLLFFDTRTSRRAVDDGESPGLFKKDLLEVAGDTGFGGSQPAIKLKFDMWLCRKEELHKKVVKAVTTSRSLFIFTQLPILGSDRLEKIKERATMVKDRLIFDLEGWRNNPSNFFMLIDVLRDAGVSKCYAVGGDVHFGYERSSMIDYATDVLTANFSKTATTIHQVVTSPMQNTFEFNFGESESGMSRYLRNLSASSVLTKDADLRVIRYDSFSKTWYLELKSHASSLSIKSGYLETTFENKQSARVGNNFVEMRINSDAATAKFFPNDFSGEVVRKDDP